MREGYTTISASVPREFSKELKLYALEHNVSVSTIIRKAIVKYLSEQK